MINNNLTKCIIYARYASSIKKDDECHHKFSSMTWYEKVAWENKRMFLGKKESCSNFGLVSLPDEDW